MWWKVSQNCLGEYIIEVHAGAEQCQAQVQLDGLCLLFMVGKAALDSCFSPIELYLSDLLKIGFNLAELETFLCGCGCLDHVTIMLTQPSWRWNFG